MVATSTDKVKVDAYMASATESIVIDGEFHEGDGEYFTVMDPRTGDSLCRLRDASADEVNRAVESVSRAHDEGVWRALSPRRRRRILENVGDQLIENATWIGAIEALDTGKPYEVALGEVKYAAETFKYYSGWIDKVYGTTQEVRSGELVVSRREPVGVCAGITPWNFPIVSLAWKIAPALAFGNTVVVKPAEQAPLSSRALLEVLLMSGVPAGAVSLLQGRGDPVGRLLASHGLLRRLSFTGSTEVGREVMRAASASLARPTLELGGKSPIIVLNDADLASAAAGVVSGCFRNAGQVCTAGSRLVVADEIADGLIDRIVGEMPPGTGDRGDLLEIDTPLISKEQLERVAGLVDRAVAAGARLVTGGSQIGSNGYFYSPTILDAVGHESEISSAEVFGPVLVVQRFKTEEEAVRLANSTVYGLAAGIYTENVHRAHRIAEKLAVGTVWINTYGAGGAAISRGGRGESGYGRELGQDAVSEYTEIKNLWLSLRQSDQ